MSPSFADVGFLISLLIVYRTEKTEGFYRDIGWYEKRKSIQNLSKKSSNL